MTGDRIGRWKLEADTATCRTEELSFRLCPKCPRHGLHDISFRGRPLTDCRPLQILLETSAPEEVEPLADLYVRDDDLIATYQSKPARPYEPQVYWRAPPGNAGPRPLEIVLAVTTQMRESRPAVLVASEMPHADVWVGILESSGRTRQLRWQQLAEADAIIHPDAAVFLFRIIGTDVSYAELWGPSDFQTASLRSTETGCRLGYASAPQVLEKGVIRKLRIQGGFLPRDVDTDWAAAWRRALETSEPPLTV